jgi:exopolyphosphatase / guanosine-5'-triphosphate,3'-diphosphate pyrophosphatase
MSTTASDTIAVSVDDDHIVVRYDGVAETVPVGVATLLTEFLRSDPPRPEELTNSIGIVTDHLDDLLHVRPDIGVALDRDPAVVIAGPAVEVVVAVEVGAAPTMPFELDRDAAEDVFRTVATEPRAERRHNPGLPAAELDRVVAASCIVVAVHRTFRLTTLSVVSIAEVQL